MTAMPKRSENTTNKQSARILTFYLTFIIPVFLNDDSATDEGF